MIQYFNPGHEMAVKNGSPYYTAPANVVAMRRDLAFLPVWYGHTGDKVLIEGFEGWDFYTSLFDVLKIDTIPIDIHQLRDSDSETVALWGVSPQGIRFFEEINSLYSLNLKVPKWNEQYVYLNSRENAKDILSDLINSSSLLSKALLPRFFTSLEDIENEVGRVCEPLLAKAPYSSSGRGLLWLPVGELTRTERQILHGILKKQQIVSIEKVLDKHVDFAMEFASDGLGGVHFVGYSLFETNKKGAYMGNVLCSQSEIIYHLETMVSSELLDSVKAKLIDTISSKYIGYEGYLGVDMMVYKEKDEYKLHPCVEVNMRANMGVLAINIQQRYLSPQSKGKLYIDFSSQIGEIYANHLDMKQKYPAEFEDCKLKKGYLSLCPVLAHSHYRAYVIVD